MSKRAFKLTRLYRTISTRVYDALHHIWECHLIKIRKLLYSLPTFFQWWPALYFEKDVSARKTARYALGLFLFFIIGTLISSVFYAVAYFVPNPIQIIFYYTAFYLQMLWSLGYVGISIFTSYNVIQSEDPSFVPYGIAAPYKIVETIESWFES